MNQQVSIRENREPSATQRIQYVIPRVDLHHETDSYRLEVEMPGVDKSGVEVTVDDGKLTLTGRKQALQREGKAVYRERGTADYRRVFDLDPSIDTASIRANLEQGLLTLTLQKAEAAKPRRIEVN